MIHNNAFTAAELGITNEAITAKENIRFYNIKEAPFRIYGLYEPLT